MKVLKKLLVVLSVVGMFVGCGGDKEKAQLITQLIKIGRAHV